jgi:hypothetical protein
LLQGNISAWHIKAKQQNQPILIQTILFALTFENHRKNARVHGIEALLIDDDSARTLIPSPSFKNGDLVL